MGQAIAVRTDFTAGEVRRLAKRAKDAAQARRLLSIAAVLDGAFACVLADAGYGLSAPFHHGLTARNLAWAVGIPRPGARSSP